MRKIALMVLVLLLTLPVMAQDAPEATETPVNPECTYLSNEVVFVEGETEIILSAESFEMLPDSDCRLGQLVLIDGEPGGETFALYVFYATSGYFYTASYSGLQDYPELIGYVEAGTNMSDGLFLYILPNEDGSYTVQSLSQDGVVSFVTITDGVPTLEEQWGNCFRLSWSGQTRSLCALQQSTGEGDTAVTTYSFRRTR